MSLNFLRHMTPATLFFPQVVKYWPEKGKSGFLVWRYLLRRDDTEPGPWTREGKDRMRQLGLTMQVCGLEVRGSSSPSLRLFSMELIAHHDVLLPGPRLPRVPFSFKSTTSQVLRRLRLAWRRRRSKPL